MRSLPWVRRALIREITRDIWRYLTPAASIETELLEAGALLQISPQELGALGRVQFLISDELGELLRQLPFLVRRLATTTACEEERSPERIRGAIQWGPTISVRQATGIPHMYVTSPARRAYQTAENELLVLVLDAVVSLAKQTGWHRSESAEVGKLVSSRVSEAGRWLQMRALLEVERRPLTPTKLARIRGGRLRRRYQAALVAYERYRLLAQHLDRPTIRRAVEGYGVVSRDDATLFELICTFKVIDALRELGWQLDRLGLFAGSLRLQGRKGPERLELLYQGVPARFKKASAYRSILSSHNIAGRSLRPDLFIAHTARGVERWLLVEAKGGERSAEESARAATFDLLAYRAAFSRVLEGQAPPIGLGIAWGADLTASHASDMMLCTPDAISKALDRFLTC